MVVQRRRHQCEFCNHSSNSRSDLKRHRDSVHYKKKPHACPFPGCGYAGAQRTGLENHMRTHTGERPHACPERGCRSIFGDPASLSRHRKEQHRLTIECFPCTHCESIIHRKSSFKEHLINRHDYSEKGAEMWARKYRHLEHPNVKKTHKHCKGKGKDACRNKKLLSRLDGSISRSDFIMGLLENPETLDDILENSGARSSPAPSESDMSDASSYCASATSSPNSSMLSLQTEWSDAFSAGSSSSFHASSSSRASSPPSATSSRSASLSPSPSGYEASSESPLMSDYSSPIFGSMPYGGSRLYEENNASSFHPPAPFVSPCQLNTPFMGLECDLSPAIDYTSIEACAPSMLMLDTGSAFPAFPDMGSMMMSPPVSDTESPIDSPPFTFDAFDSVNTMLSPLAALGLGSDINRAPSPLYLSPPKDFLGVGEDSGEQAFDELFGWSGDMNFS
ncbi:hypothetical protein C8Q75DRAFT_218404 [Abortiporus biennis]|nr:hypothetical protein C8Q75DRAFT_218404 [Abortiporus biennis]